MANVRQFNISLEHFGKSLPKKVGQLQRRAALTIMRDLIVGSPVDTGRFKSSWMVGIGVADRSVMPTRRGSERESGASKREERKRLNANSRDASATSFDRLKLLTPETVNGKEPIIISNNLPYATALADGHSQQAPSGWIEAAVSRAQRELNVVKFEGTK